MVGYFFSMNYLFIILSLYFFLLSLLLGSFLKGISLIFSKYCLISTSRLARTIKFNKRRILEDSMFSLTLVKWYILNDFDMAGSFSLI